MVTAILKNAAVGQEGQHYHESHLYYVMISLPLGKTNSLLAVEDVCYLILDGSSATHPTEPALYQP